MFLPPPDDEFLLKSLPKKNNQRKKNQKIFLSRFLLSKFYFSHLFIMNKICMKEKYDINSERYPKKYFRTFQFWALEKKVLGLFVRIEKKKFLFC